MCLPVIVLLVEEVRLLQGCGLIHKHGATRLLLPSGMDSSFLCQRSLFSTVENKVSELKFFAAQPHVEPSVISPPQSHTPAGKIKYVGGRS